MNEYSFIKRQEHFSQENFSLLDEANAYPHDSTVTTDQYLIMKRISMINYHPRMGRSIRF